MLLTPYNAQDIPHNKELSIPKIYGAEVVKPWFSGLWSKRFQVGYSEMVKYSSVYSVQFSH